MVFVIQAGNPALRRPAENEFEELSTAIQAVFPMDTEASIMFWNWVPIKLSYKYDFGVMMDDLLPMLDNMLDSGHGATSVYWSSSTFTADWHLQWANGRLSIGAEWKIVSGAYENLLNGRRQLETDHPQFLYEWKLPLQRISTAIDQSGIRVSDTEGNLARLRRIEAAIGAYGQLYGSADRGW